MKKYLPNIAGVLLALMFLAASIPILFNLMPAPKLPPGAPETTFFQAFWPSHYMYFVKIFEFTGAILVAIPRTRNLGLLVLGPIIVNILAFHILIKHGDGLQNPMVIAVVALALYLLWVGRKKFAALINLKGEQI
jgi:putative oxidoreductase